jgi:hypothetical protein
MSISTALPDAVPSSATGAGRNVAASLAVVRDGLLARCRAWLARRDTTARLRDLDPHLARDMGVAPCGDGCPEGFATDPRPLWGIGLTPQPMDTQPPRAERCRG